MTPNAPAGQPDGTLAEDRIQLQDHLWAAVQSADIPRMVFQPVVDLRRGTTVGFEALARFDLSAQIGPDGWFALAKDAGFGPMLEARAITKALTARSHLPPNCFMAVNVDPNFLASDEVRSAFLSVGDLRGVVIEITEHAMVADYDAVIDALGPLRAAGASVAIDDTGAGYASLEYILRFRPGFVKLDRTLVAGLDRDEAKAALVEMIGQFAGRIDAWVLAEGVERIEEVDALVRLGVPLGQGYLFAHPGEPWAAVAPDVSGRIVHRADARNEGHGVAGLVERVPIVAVGQTGLDSAVEVAGQALLTNGHLDIVLVLDEYRRPIRAVVRRGAAAESAPVMRIAPTAGPGEVARRCLTRPVAQRFDPLAVCDETGRSMGVVRVERLLERLSSSDEAPARIVSPARSAAAVGSLSIAGTRPRLRAIAGGGQMHPARPAGAGRFISILPD